MYLTFYGFYLLQKYIDSKYEYGKNTRLQQHSGKRK